MGLIAFIIVVILITIWLWRKNSSETLEPVVKRDVPFIDNRKIRFVIHKGPYILDRILETPKNLWLYEDNASNPSRRGRAHIGDEENTAAIITKHSRGTSSEAWYQDDGSTELDQIDTSFKELEAKIISGQYHIIVIPEDFGHDGELHIRAPKTFMYLLGLVYELVQQYDPTALQESVGDWLKFQATLSGKTKKRTSI